MVCGTILGNHGTTHISLLYDVQEFVAAIFMYDDMCQQILQKRRIYCHLVMPVSSAQQGMKSRFGVSEYHLLEGIASRVNQTVYRCAFVGPPWSYGVRAVPAEEAIQWKTRQ